jgi:hypothetical protein
MPAHHRCLPSLRRTACGEKSASARGAPPLEPSGERRQ